MVFQFAEWNRLADIAVISGEVDLWNVVLGTLVFWLELRKMW